MKIDLFQSCGHYWVFQVCWHIECSTFTASFSGFWNVLNLQNGLVQFSSVQSLSSVWLFVTPWITARQASLSITNSRSLCKLMSIKLVMQSSHLILCHPLLLPPTPPSIRVFSNESALCMRCPKNWSFSFNISLSNEHPGLISFRMDWLDLLVEISPNSDELRQI